MPTSLCLHVHLDFLIHWFNLNLMRNLTDFLFCFVGKSFTYIWKVEWQILREKERHVFFLLVSSYVVAVARPGPDENQEPETSCWSPTLVPGAHTFGPSCSAFPGAFSRMGIGAFSSQAGPVIWDASVAGGNLTCCVIMLAPPRLSLAKNNQVHLSRINDLFLITLFLWLIHHLIKLHAILISKLINKLNWLTNK